MSLPPLRVLVADDEALARRRLVRLLSALPGVELAGEVDSGEAVLQAARERRMDVVLLDVQMPGLSGVDALALLPGGGPQVILCTAHAEHAVAAFEHGAVDYVLKPVEPARLQRALERARERRRPAGAAAPAASGGGALAGRLPIPTRAGIVLVDPASISHAHLEGELVTVFSAQGDYLTDFTLQELEARLPPDAFMRVHRRALLNLAHVQRLEPQDTGGYVARTLRGHAVEVSRQSARELRRLLGLRRGPAEDEA